MEAEIYPFPEIKGRLKAAFAQPPPEHILDELEILHGQLELVATTDELRTLLKRQPLPSGKLNSLYEMEYLDGDKRMHLDDTFEEYCYQVIDWLQELGLPVDEITATQWYSEEENRILLLMDSAGVDVFGEDFQETLTGECEDFTFPGLACLLGMMIYLDNITEGWGETILFWENGLEKIGCCYSQPPWWVFVRREYYRIREGRLRRLMKSVPGLHDMYKIVTHQTGNCLMDLDTSENLIVEGYTPANVLALLTVAGRAQKIRGRANQAEKYFEDHPEFVEELLHMYEACISPRRRGHTLKYLKRKGEEARRRGKMKLEGKDDED
jgi:hypothetical protein